MMQQRVYQTILQNMDDGLILVKPGVNVNGAYYRDVLLLQHKAAGQTSHRRRVLHISAGQCSDAPGS